MEYGVQPVNPYSPCRLSGCFDAFVQNMQAMHDPGTWMSSRTSLQNQKGYLEDLLSKTATTLNTLRDKQTRNERALSTNPLPRSKKKKILQNRWRTDKTIKTCENEERVILDCLRVCRSNIYTLESIINPIDTSSTAVEYISSNSKCSYTESATTDLDWNGWTNDEATSPFHRERQHALVVDEIPPEACLDGTGLGNTMTAGSRRPPPLPPRVRAPPPAMLLPVPPNTAYTQFNHSSLSPEAACFEPSITHFPHAEAKKRKELDKLSISGLLASKRMQQMQKRRFSDAAIGHIFRRLSSSARPSVAHTHRHASWGPDSAQHQEHWEALAAAMQRRTHSV